MRNLLIPTTPPSRLLCAAVLLLLTPPTTSTRAGDHHESLVHYSSEILPQSFEREPVDTEILDRIIRVEDSVNQTYNELVEPTKTSD